MNTCDACGVTGQNDSDEILCRLCKLRQQAAATLARDNGADQYHMIQGMIRVERYRRGDPYHFPAPPVPTSGWDDLAWARFVTFD